MSDVTDFLGLLGFPEWHGWEVHLLLLTMRPSLPYLIYINQPSNFGGGSVLTLSISVRISFNIVTQRVGKLVFGGKNLTHLVWEVLGIKQFIPRSEEELENTSISRIELQSDFKQISDFINNMLHWFIYNYWNTDFPVQP